MKQFREGLVCKAHTLLYRSTSGSRVIKKKKKRRRHLKLVPETRETLRFEMTLGRMIAVRAAGDVQFPACRAFTARVRPANPRNCKATLEKGIQTPMAQGRSTIIISMIKWIRTIRLSIKNSLHIISV